MSPNDPKTYRAEDYNERSDSIIPAYLQSPRRVVSKPTVFKNLLQIHGLSSQTYNYRLTTIPLYLLTSLALSLLERDLHKNKSRAAPTHIPNTLLHVLSPPTTQLRLNNPLMLQSYASSRTLLTIILKPTYNLQHTYYKPTPIPTVLSQRNPDTILILYNSPFYNYINPKAPPTDQPETMTETRAHIFYNYPLSWPQVRAEGMTEGNTRAGGRTLPCIVMMRC